jgi:hypothetical protein
MPSPEPTPATVEESDAPTVALSLLGFVAALGV